ncbi:hypothetical protein M9H77_28451 [Catharanthus roseus]|uniref:Uncharacterized protein n=1 Tax=Catharanthus roseus TaxID=4058 RepID=A0ACC0AI33_CATRO|nr:hypothetical protein M9H77_28451 [Catharanthus roseus]
MILRIAVIITFRKVKLFGEFMRSRQMKGNAGYQFFAGGKIGFYAPVRFDVVMQDDLVYFPYALEAFHCTSPKLRLFFRFILQAWHCEVKCIQLRPEAKDNEVLWLNLVGYTFWDEFLIDTIGLALIGIY